jgi:hypothetical protein
MKQRGVTALAMSLCVAFPRERVLIDAIVRHLAGMQARGARLHRRDQRASFSLVSNSGGR